ncbi:hypothetical protein SGFS_046590 [Streptomyces graminofaciens]|uniref:Peptidase S8/S53 domain-containing protein n=1 Tax=Streptomyces graminofaciens TaxID=68212 RepID=A0ABM7FBX3_9ACTN|nr:S8 family serine peptidase [Streptomyces graminofaciens]BBC33365.1 hypothetical protein SGFS_046590 [Streptomyces graminofaciens]
MRRQVQRARSATIATAAAVALTVGLTAPASTAAEQATGDDGTTGADLTADHRITLITGDRVRIDADGRVRGLERAKGRAGVPVQVREADGHTYVVPADAARLIATGTLDRRLFDVTELSRAAIRKAHKRGLKLIVGYRGTAADARADVRDAGDTKVRRTLRTLNADAVLTPKDDAAELWKAVTDADGTAATGVAHVWLDGVRKVSLDKSVPQIGAPKAWKAGYDGKGVTIAVLDTGVDATHPDLKGQVIADKNFSASPDTTDKYGHGTHVASIAAGTGAKSKGRYKGVAPGAKLLNGKVLSDDGSGDDSGIIAGMDWAAEQGADVVNLSLGGGDTPEIDPMEAAINKLSKEKGILFAVAAGNEGDYGGQTIGSPGSAEAALTVGAVDDKDKLASFSSRGPGLDGRIKPDVTAPGVDITAAAAPDSVIDKEVGQKPAGYLTISGTSMATPHVAGAAAILKQQHPEWTYTELKGALTASTKGGKYTPFQQGSGRIQVDKAIKQTVVADPVSVSFGVALWPHTDDKPKTEKLTYKNLGKKDVTLTLALAATDPKGKAAPAGFFELGAKKVTVPAGGGTASVKLTVDTKLGGGLNGAYSAYVTATGGGQSVRTAAAVQREVESYDVNFKVIGRDGKPAENYLIDMTGVSGLADQKWFMPYDADGSVKVRAPKGGYILNSAIIVAEDDIQKGADWLARPQLTVDRKLDITLDARKTKPVDITVPAASAESVFASPDYSVRVGDNTYAYGWWLDTYENFRTAHLGPAVTGGRLSQSWQGHWTAGAATQYGTATGGKVKKLATGYTKHWKKSELAEVKTGLGSSVAGKKGAVVAWAALPGGSASSGIGVEQTLPGTRTLYVSGAGGVKWGLDFEQYAGVDDQGFPIVEAYYTMGDSQAFKAGRSYAKRFNVAVFGPRIAGTYGIRRDGDHLYGLLPMFADGKGHAGASVYASAKTTLYRNGEKYASAEDALDGAGQFKVPPGLASYRLTTSVRRAPELARVSSRIDASWTFKSKKTSTDTKLPVSVVRFGTGVALDGTVSTGAKAFVPVTVQGAAAGGNLKSLTVYVSFDGGEKWTRTAVTGGHLTFKNPAAGESVSFRAEVTDKKGNVSKVTIYDAYFGR